MKPRRHLFRAPAIFGTPLKYGVPVFIGFTFAISGLTANAGDILRGGTQATNKPGRSGSGAPTPAATDAARANAKDTLARTTRTIAAMRDLQNAARNAAIRNGTNNLGKNPNKPTFTLPNVPNGIALGGLKPTSDPTKWTGADGPVQTVKNGKTQVTIKQTTQQALLNWDSFNVGKKTTLTFDQSKGGADVGKWIAFNKISDASGNPTQILGKINADGQVYLINPNGIIFGAGSQVNARGLTASSLPINENLITRGILNNPDSEFLFSGMNFPDKVGDIVVQAGAKISSSVSADGNGGRVFLAGANVTNSGTISTPAGQTILAAGLEVGILAHASEDPSVRGLDVYVGAVTDPASTSSSYAGTATNLGLIEGSLGNVTITGKDVIQSGVIESSTSVSLNGSVRLLANYGAVSNTAYQTDGSQGISFLFHSSGSVTFGENSLTRILPEYGSKDTVAGTQLALRSQIEAQGKSIYMGSGAEIFAPNALVSFKAGVWTQLPNAPYANFLRTDGQVYLDNGAKINLAGTTDATASALQNYLTVTLRGSELSVAPLQRDGVLRGDTIIVDITKTGTYNGKKWVGTPLADVSGYLNLIQRDVAQLTTAGGTLDISAGNSVVIRSGASVDVSGGWTNFTGSMVQTTRLSSNGHLIDISEATPDQVYDGIFTGSATVVSTKWGVKDTFTHALSPTGKYYQGGFFQGANAGSISITSPAVALDGKLLGTVVAGTYQVRSGSSSSNLPLTGSLSLNLEGQTIVNSAIQSYAPNHPTVEIGTGKQEDVADFDVNSSALSAERTGRIYLSESLLSERGFGNLTLVDEGGDVVLPETVTLTPQSGSSLSWTAANIDLEGKIISAGSSLSFKALNLTSFEQGLISDTLPPPNEGRGVIHVGSSAVISTAGLVTDDRSVPADALDPIALDGGGVTISAYTAHLDAGGQIDVSGGYQLNSAGKGTYGNGGSISINAGIDPGANPIPGGVLSLGSKLSGFSGKTGGTLAIQAPYIQIGGDATGTDGLLLDPGFFNKGGFSTFKLAGLGFGKDDRPGLLVATGTTIAPVVKSYEAVTNVPDGGPISLQVVKNVAGVRNPVNLTFFSPTKSTQNLTIAGDVIVEAGAIIRTDPGGSVTLAGRAVAVLGSIIAPGGSVTVGGGSTAGLGQGVVNPLVTTEIGEHAVISTAGAVVYLPDPYGRRVGKVFSGGTISLTGNISAATGAVLDVSGSSGIFDLDPDTVVPSETTSRPIGIPGAPPNGIASVPVRVDSDAGTISFKGNELLFSDATLLANAGGKTALGGKLIVSSDMFNPTGGTVSSSTVRLHVTQTGSEVSGGIGSIAGSGGHFAADSFAAGGFDSLSLEGVVGFEGDVVIAARGELSVSSGSILSANGNVHLSAAHVTLGGTQEVTLPGKEVSTFLESVLPTSGTGSLLVEAGLIDLGNLSLQQIGSASLVAANGDIRGSGWLQIAGDLTLRAGQIFPNTASKLTIIAYDHSAGGVNQEGHVTIEASGTRDLPYSAGGTLSIYATNISQNGTLRAPFGTINLGWDGSGSTPQNLLAGSGAAGSFPITKNLVLGSGSITSVSAVDPVTGKGLFIPYGVSTTGENWIDPHGVDITSSGVPEKNISLSGGNIITEKGSSIDLRGGGDLYADRWVQGLGGLTDILATSNSFAIIPSYSPAYAPVSVYNTASSTSQAPNLIDGSAGYTNSSLHVGDRIYLAGSKTLAAGYYTLLPARYALIPGAVLVTAAGGSGGGTVEMPDASSLVSGYRYNSLNAERTLSTISTRFEVASSKVVRARAEYQEFFANTFLKNAAIKAGNVIPRLPMDSGRLVFQSTQGLSLSGAVDSSSIAGGRGAAIDISTPLDVVITSGKAVELPGAIYLDSATLNSFDAESLLIGGRRTSTVDGAAVTVTSNHVTVDNSGSTLAAQDLILVADGGIALADGASLASRGKSSASEDLILSGNGTLVRISADHDATIVRSGITSATSPLLSVGSGTTLKGGSITLDSSDRISLDSGSSLNAESYQFDAGSIALLLDNPGALASGTGLVVSNDLLGQLQSAASVKLSSYGSIDLYGTGTLGSTTGLASLSLSAGQIRGMNASGGIARISAGNIRLENLSSAASGPAVGSQGGALEFVADSIELGEGELAINGYSDVLLDGSRGITGEGTGGLSVRGDLTVKAPVFAGAAGAKRTLAATGAISLAASTRAATSVLSSGLGSSLAITGSSVNVDIPLSLQSGSLTITAKSGDLTINGDLDVSGTTQRFNDVTKITDAGNINLVADEGNVVLTHGSALDLSSSGKGGNGGNLSVSVAAGSFSSAGDIMGSGGSGGENGGFALDVKSLSSLMGLNEILTTANLTEVQKIRVRSGDVVVDGTATAHDFELTADQGFIRVTGTVDASGATGGNIHLAAHGDLTVESGAVLTVAGRDFSSAGKGGSITLESGTQLDGVAGTGELSILKGSVIDLSVASKVAGDALTEGSSASLGEFSGKLHLRAPRTADNDELLVGSLEGTVIDASSILVEGYQLYDLTDSGGTITSAIQTGIRNDGNAFLGEAGATNGHYTEITDRLLENNKGLADVLVLAPGAEVINRTGDLTLGAEGSTTTSDWNLSTFRFGAKSAPGVLTLRAAGDLVFNNALSDGFSPTLTNKSTNWLWTARLSQQNSLLPVNEQSWSYRLSAGADLGAAGFGTVLPTTALADGKGSIRLGKNATNVSTTSGASATTAAAIANRFQVIRTGSGDIDINAGRDVVLLNQFATIYTAGTRLSDFTLGGLFRTPSLQDVSTQSLGAAQQSYSVQYSMAGGDVGIHAGGNIERLTLSDGVLVPDSQFQMPANWLYRRGYVDAATGLFASDASLASASTTWWVDFSNFFQGVGALGGGDVTLSAGNNIINVDAVIPTNARMPGYTDITQTQNAAPDASKLVELGGGNLVIRAGNNLDAGVYYVERGKGELTAGGSIVTNATRSVLTSNVTLESSYTELPTTLFLGKGGFDVSANGSVLLGPVANPFLLPGGLLNGYNNKSYFSTYAEGNYVNVGSLGGDITFRENVSAEGLSKDPILQLWFDNKLLLKSFSASDSKPWLRLNETSVTPFATLFALQPGTIDAISFSGNVNLVGDLLLSPAPLGNLGIFARGALNSFLPDGVLDVAGTTVTTWGTSIINLSDADPSRIPGSADPLGFLSFVAGTGTSAEETGPLGFLDSINLLFAESGGTLGSNTVLQTKQTLHAPGLLHAGDHEPLRLYATEGDISGLELFSPKAARVIAGNDISDISFYIQNTRASDVSIVASGRDLLPYTTSSPQRQAATTGNNQLISADSAGVLDGDIQISGPGTLEVLAGRNLDLGTGSNNADGTGSGITSIGDTRNPSLPNGGANLVVSAGTGLAVGLTGSELNLTEFIDRYVLTKSGAKYLQEISPGVDFAGLSDEEQARLAIEVFSRIIRDAGRSHAKTGNYKTAKAAIKVLFGNEKGKWDGEILTRSRDIRTSNGGDISILAPGGGVTLASTTTGSTLAPPGIITASGGNISIFANNDVNIGIGRIFTLRGGNEIIWSTHGDIAAGSSSKTVQTASPTRVRIDPQSAAVQTDLSGLATGGGIGVLDTVKGVKPGDVDLIAPQGTVDAGDAGISVSGNLNIAANQVLNTGNISVGGSSAGASAPTSSAPSAGSLTSASNTTAAATAAAAELPASAARNDAPQVEDQPSVITVDVIGYGDGGDDEDEDKKKAAE